MPFHDLIQKHVSEADAKAVDEAIEVIEAILADKVVNLSTEERQRYGSIKEKNKLVVNKAWDYHTAQPDLSSPDVDWVEFEADYKDRVFFETRSNRFLSLVERMMNAKMLHDWDNYQNALTDYDYTKYKAGTKATGFQKKATDLGQFFEKSKPAEDENASGKDDKEQGEEDSGTDTKK